MIYFKPAVRILEFKKTDNCRWRKIKKHMKHHLRRRGRLSQLITSNGNCFFISYFLYCVTARLFEAVANFCTVPNPWYQQRQYDYSWVALPLLLILIFACGVCLGASIFLPIQKVPSISKNELPGGKEIIESTKKKLSDDIYIDSIINNASGNCVCYMVSTVCLFLLYFLLFYAYMIHLFLFIAKKQ